MSPLPLIDLPPAEDSAVSALPGTDRKNVANQDMGSADLLDFTTPPKPLLPFEYRSPNGHPVQLRGLPGPGGLDRPHDPKPQARMHRQRHTANPRSVTDYNGSAAHQNNANWSHTNANWSHTSEAIRSTQIAARHGMVFTHRSST